MQQLAALQYLQLYSTYSSTVPTALQYLQLYSTYSSTVPTALQYLQLYSTYSSTVPTALQYLQLYSTYSSTVPTVVANRTKGYFLTDRLIFASTSAITRVRWHLQARSFPSPPSCYKEFVKKALGTGQSSRENFPSCRLLSYQPASP